MKYLLIILSFLFATNAQAEKVNIKDMVADQIVSQPIEYTVDKVFSIFPFKYWYSLIQSNRVHSATSGKGYRVAIPEIQNNLVLYAQPVNTAGPKRRLFKHNTLFKGKYRLTSSKGTKAGGLTVSKDTNIDYLKILAVTGSKADLQFARLTIETSPSNAQITIKGYPDKYHKGMKIPEGKYQVSVSAKGYSAKSATLDIKQKQNNHFKLSLNKVKPIPSKTAQKPTPKVAPVIAVKPQPQQLTQPTIKQEQLTHTKATASTGIDPLKPVDVALTFNWKSRQSDRILLTLKDKEGNSYKDRSRIRGREVTLNMKLKPGEYEAKLLLRNKGQYEIGKITVVAGKDNILTKYLQ
ncbi:PEGA domain-containing protein [Shewanella schlegeliana]|uniref:PEGA domain-containing protein n=1 Tax=Shewanella schlegeliana TaxID=190308 RepID=A0ABS1T141_9GAMM|nr:PEGA domain-containing protein [Shewanella schlegeliana]MBL4914305.1 PEGA domain-containing protein [Shewanella schlegeliana]MCL1109472.1 PEGA domain-containing protein [Shewanella schlegeliana]GIU33505.1 hypothetical protein TUM4433_28020 [Shewanella schlegeliana]